MPIVSGQVTGKAQLPDGKTVDLPPQMVMTAQGPRVQVSIGVGQQLAAQLLQEGKELPAPISGLALIDTGASGTCVDEQIAAQLKLPVIDVVKAASATEEEAERNVYPIQIEVTGLPITINAPRAMGAPLQVQGFHVLIGRDLLQHCVLVYNGLVGSFSLSI